MALINQVQLRHHNIIVNRSIPMHKSCAVIAAIALLLITGCDYARMSDQESLRPYEVKLPEMPANTVPIKNGIQALRESAPSQLRIRCLKP